MADQTTLGYCQQREQLELGLAAEASDPSARAAHLALAAAYRGRAEYISETTPMKDEKVAA